MPFKTANKDRRANELPEKDDEMELPREIRSSLLRLYAPFRSAISLGLRPTSLVFKVEFLANGIADFLVYTSLACGK
jgi:hypothetical protein